MLRERALVNKEDGARPNTWTRESPWLVATYLAAGGGAD